MAFCFQLEAVLRLRRSLERQQELLLQAANHEVLQMQRRILALKEWQKALQRNEEESLKAGTAAAELLFDNVLNSALLEHVHVFQSQLLQLENARDKARAALEEARRKREMLENLRDQQQRYFRMEQARREQRSIDELFLMRRKKQTVR